VPAGTGTLFAVMVPLIVAIAADAEVANGAVTKTDPSKANTAARARNETLMISPK
jgi:hypothetical protein